jgi:hypothetical protein
MYTALYSTSFALAAYLRAQLEALPPPGLGFGGAGARVVTLNSPQEMREDLKQEGLSVWLYRIVRDETRLNIPDERLPGNLVRHPPLPLRVHYLMTPVTFNGHGGGGPDVEQQILGRVMQALHTHAVLRGVDLDGTELEGTGAEIHARLETLVLDELSRVWEALEGSFQLAVSYELSIVNIDAALEPCRIAPVQIALPEAAIIMERV